MIRRLLLPAPLLIAALVAAVVAVPGCGTKPSQYKGSDSNRVDEQSPWAKAASALRRDSDAPACRQALTQLNNDLAARPAADLQPESLSPEAERAIQEALVLKEHEVKEIRSSSYGGLDPYHLAQCLYLADAARSLDVAALPPARQADLAFRWVVRQVTLAPWVLDFPDAGQSLTAVLPPLFVLRRGSGSGLERAYVYLALLHQLGLDGCLVAGPDAGNLVGSPLFPLGQRPIPQGPFWAVGARVGADVFLFDPWRGEPMPGAEGRVATLAQVRANPDLLKPWRDDKDRPWTVPVDLLTGATAYLAAPLSSLAPRFRRLEQELKGDLPVRLAADPIAMKARFAAEAKVPDAKLWNPPGDGYSTTRVLGSFLSAEKGGFATSDKLHDDYLLSLIPRTVFAVPAELQPQNELDVGVPEAVDRLMRSSAGVFAASFMAPPTPREQIQRGDFAQVTATLVEKRKEYARALQRVQTDRNREVEIGQWSKRARTLYENLTKARRGNNPDELADAQAAVDNFWRETATANAIIDAAVAEAGLAEATYLLAQSMHEQAERAQAKVERLTADPRHKAATEDARKEAVLAWREAKGWWTLYEQGPAAVQQRTYPGRAAHAKQLAARAVELAAR